MINLDIFEKIANRFPAVKARLNDTARAALKAANLANIKKKYHDAITKSLIDYFEGGGRVSVSQNRFKQATTEAFGAAFDAGWLDGGAELPFDGEALKWFNARVAEEYVYIEQTFQQARTLRRQKDFDWFTWATARADGYTAALDGVYNAGMMLAKGNQMLTWHLGHTEKHCRTCKSLNGKSHRAAWYIKYNYIPRKPGAGMDCQGYNCDCRLTDKNGYEVTI